MKWWQTRGCKIPAMASQASSESSDPPQSVILCVAQSQQLVFCRRLCDPFADGPSAPLLTKLISGIKLYLTKKTVGGLDLALRQWYLGVRLQ